MSLREAALFLVQLVVANNKHAPLNCATLLLQHSLVDLPFSVLRAVIQFVSPSPRSPFFSSFPGLSTWRPGGFVLLHLIFGVTRRAESC